MDMDTKRKVFREVANAVHLNTHSYAVALVDFDTLEVASGTIVQIGHRFFVATAAHVVPGVPNGRLMMLGRYPRKFSEGCPVFLNHGFDGTAGRDVAFLEIEPKALGWLGKSPLDLEFIDDLGAGNPRMYTAMTGFPGKTVGDPVRTGEFVPRYVSVALMPIAPADYATQVEPVPEADAPANAARDVFLNYRDEDARSLDTYQKIALPDVGGMSGGGYYDFGKFAEGVLWNPHNLRLHAIQSSWNNREPNHYVRGTQIVYWAKLVAQRYPDIADLLRHRLPRIDDI